MIYGFATLSKDEDGDKDTQNTQRIENTETVSGIVGIDWWSVVF